MIPIRDNIPSLIKPVIGQWLLGINVVLFLGELLLMATGQLNAFLQQFAIIPAREALHFLELLQGDFTVVPALLFPIILAMFLHGGFAHIIGNMLFLWVFGDNVEDLMGHGRFLAFYLSCWILASAAQIALDPTSVIPNLGASGAIAGVLGAYLINYPKARVQAILPLGFLFLPIQIPAMFYLGWWFVQQTLYGIGSLGVPADMSGGIAFFAHVGGFVAGVALFKVFAIRRSSQALF
ncbi:MAG: rhomboid family intramembrane serine protease [Cyanobacteria bacterium J06648_11]